MIFICHSDQDEGPYTGLCLALENAGLSFWNPKTMKAGASLKHQLREAISKCDVCIFIATRSSVNSKWCLTETGAFWGVGKRIILYQANPDIDEMPPLFQGDLSICNMRALINQAREELSEARSKERPEPRALDKYPTDLESAGKSSGVESSDHDEIDIQIVLEGYIKSLKGLSHLLKFSDVDEYLRLPVGSTKKSLPNVATNLGFRIEKEGTNYIRIEKDAPGPARVLRA